MPCLARASGCRGRREQAGGGADPRDQSHHRAEDDRCALLRHARDRAATWVRPNGGDAVVSCSRSTRSTWTRHPEQDVGQIDVGGGVHITVADLGNVSPTVGLTAPTPVVDETTRDDHRAGDAREPGGSRVPACSWRRSRAWWQPVGHRAFRVRRSTTRCTATGHVVADSKDPNGTRYRGVRQQVAKRQVPAVIRSRCRRGQAGRGDRDVRRKVQARNRRRCSDQQQGEAGEQSRPETGRQPGGFAVGPGPRGLWPGPGPPSRRAASEEKKGTCVSTDLFINVRCR